MEPLYIDEVYFFTDNEFKLFCKIRFRYFPILDVIPLSRRSRILRQYSSSAAAPNNQFIKLSNKLTIFVQERTRSEETKYFSNCVKSCKLYFTRGAVTLQTRCK